MSDPLTINGSQLRQSRESLGWSLGEVASRACLSVKQVKQLEEGGASSFYSDNVKLTAARKVAGILGVTEDELLGRPEVEHVEDSASPAEHTQEATSHTTEQHRDSAVEETVPAHTPNIDLEPAMASAQVAQGNQPIIVPGVQALTIRSEVLHFLAQPPEEGHEDQHLGGSSDLSELTDSSIAVDSEHFAQTSDSDGAADREAIVGGETQAHTDHESAVHPGDESDTLSAIEKGQNKSSSASNLLKIIVLFLLALGIAAFFAQKTNEEHSEPPPPLQVVPESSATDSNAKPEESANNPSPGNSVNAGPNTNGNTATNPGASLKPVAPAPLKSPSTDQKSITPAPAPSSSGSSSTSGAPSSNSGTNSSSTN